MPRLKDQALVLRETDWSETSQVVTLLTAGHGLFRGLAKGSKRQSPGAVARFSGGLAPLTAGQVVAVVKPEAGLATVTEWDLQEPFAALRGDYTALNLAWYAADLAQAVLPEHQPHPGAYALLRELWEQLTALPDPGAGAAAATAKFAQGAAVLRYQWALLVEAGFTPRLDVDARSGSELAPAATYLFDAVAGGLTADDPRAPADKDGNEHGPWRVRQRTVEVLRAVADAGSMVETHAALAAWDAAALERANRLLGAYWQATLEKPVPTLTAALWNNHGE